MTVISAAKASRDSDKCLSSATGMVDTSFDPKHSPLTVTNCVTGRLVWGSSLL